MGAKTLVVLINSTVALSSNINYIIQCNSTALFNDGQRVIRFYLSDWVIALLILDALWLIVACNVVSYFQHFKKINKLQKANNKIMCEILTNATKQVDHNVIVGNESKQQNTLAEGLYSNPAELHTHSITVYVAIVLHMMYKDSGFAMTECKFSKVVYNFHVGYSSIFLLNTSTYSLVVGGIVLLIVLALI